jgi:hypothetical protein
VLFEHPVDHQLLPLPVVGRDGQNRRALPGFVVENVAQLTELTGAVGSPVAAVEDQDHVVRAAEIGERCPDATRGWTPGNGWIQPEWIEGGQASEAANMGRVEVPMM